MKKPSFGQILSVITGVWFISIGVGSIVNVVKGLRK